jgi:excisionase family DNA binding protein
MDKKLVTVAEAALLMGISRALLYQKVMSGEIRSIKIGRARRIPVSVIDEWIAKQLAEAAEEAQSDLS